MAIVSFLAVVVGNEDIPGLCLTILLSSQDKSGVCLVEEIFPACSVLLILASQLDGAASKKPEGDRATFPSWEADPQLEACSSRENSSVEGSRHWKEVLPLLAMHRELLQSLSTGGDLLSLFSHKLGPKEYVPAC